MTVLLEESGRTACSISSKPSSSEEAGGRDLLSTKPSSSKEAEGAFFFI
jgi:hypothetical protein